MFRPKMVVVAARFMERSKSEILKPMWAVEELILWVLRDIKTIPNQKKLGAGGVVTTLYAVQQDETCFLAHFAVRRYYI